MDVLNIKVKHAVFGVGTVTESDDKYITVQFAEKSRRFEYPGAFEKFIKAEDSSVQESILNYISAVNQAKEERIQAELAARKAEENSKVAEDTAKRSALLQRQDIHRSLPHVPGVLKESA